MFTDFLLLALITVIAVSAILNELIYYDKQLIITFGLVNIVKKKALKFWILSQLAENFGSFSKI